MEVVDGHAKAQLRWMLAPVTGAKGIDNFGSNISVYDAVQITLKNSISPLTRSGVP